MLPVYHRGWLGWGGQQQKPQQHSTTKTDEKILLSSDLPMDCSIPDNRRSVLSIAISPLGNLAALVDSFGRILLLNCDSLAIRRMWKGMYLNNYTYWATVHLSLWFDIQSSATLLLSWQLIVHMPY